VQQETGPDAHGGDDRDEDDEDDDVPPAGTGHLASPPRVVRG
jgi:hypothetical protein